MKTERLDSAISELESQSEILVDFNNSYSQIIYQLKELNKETKNILNLLTKNNNNLEEISQLVNQSVTELDAKLTKLRNENNTFNEQISLIMSQFVAESEAQIINLRDENNTFNTNFQQALTLLVDNLFADVSSKIELRLTSLESLIEEKIDQIYTENRRFQRELQNTISSMLDKHRSDIQVSVRDESTSLKAALGEKFDNQTSLFEEQKSLFKNLRLFSILILILLVLSIGLFASLQF